MFDYAIVGAGLSGCVFAEQMHRAGKKCVIIDKRPHIGGNCFDAVIHGQRVHLYGIHVFHTSNMRIWEYVQQFAAFRPFNLSAVNSYRNLMFSSPLNMHSFAQLWAVYTPEEAMKRIARTLEHTTGDSLEAYALRTIGRELYELSFKHAITRHWGTSPEQLPASIMRRIPVRFTYDTNYYRDTVQAMPDSYTGLFDKLTQGIPVILGVDFFHDRDYWERYARKIVYTGKIDEYFNYCYGHLPYRSLEITHQRTPYPGHYGAHMVRYTDETPIYRVIEWDTVHPPHTPREHGYSTVETATWHTPSNDPMYPVPTEDNRTMYNRYAALAQVESRTLFIGRLARYQYLDMHQAIGMALKAAETELAGARHVIDLD